MRPPRPPFSRRDVLRLFGAGAGVALVGCGSGSETEPFAPDGGPPSNQGSGLGAPDAGDLDAAAGDAGSSDSGPASPAAQVLAAIDTIVVVMMENRSFDHLLGQLRRDGSYAAAAAVDGLTGAESNPDPSGAAVPVFRLDDFTPADPDHSWDASHNQYDNGKNDGFVITHAGASQNEVMGFHDRSQIPFYYWLADNFAVCDRWHASVLGPTWPNRSYLHAATSVGKKANAPWIQDAPTTVWERMAAAKLTAKNYFAGRVSWLAGAYPGKVVAGVNPTAPISSFFQDAAQGALPRFSIIDPDFEASDDHPSHDVHLGQAFIRSIYQALAASPQWSRSLLVVTYDEHGGFFDHVPPPAAPDDIADFRRFGFRVPAFVIGPHVKKGYVSSTLYDHTSVLATLRARWGIQSLTTRDYAAAPLLDCLDPMKLAAPSPPAANPPSTQISWRNLRGLGVSSQPELTRMVERGAIPAHLLDPRPAEARVLDWLRRGERLGALRLR